MTAKVFVDSNVLIYAHDADAGHKHERATGSLRKLWDTRTGRLSTQVLQEFYVNTTRKLKVPLSKGAAREVVRNYSAWVESPITASTIARGSELSEIWQLSFWDSMILAAAEECEASHLLSQSQTISWTNV